MELSSDQLAQVEQYSMINYTVRQIAIVLNVSVDKLYTEYDDTESEFRRLYERGRLVAQANIDKANLKKATEGNVTAIQIYDKRAKEARAAEAKARIFGRS